MSNKALEIKRQRENLEIQLQSKNDMLENLLGGIMSPKRFISVVGNAASRNPKLLTADRASMLLAVMSTAQLGLDPDPVLGHAHFVPFRVGGVDKVQLIVGYQGYIHLARNSGEILDFYAHAVHAKDKFSYSYGLRKDLEHIPAPGDRGEVIAAYAVVKYKNGAVNFDVLQREDIDSRMEGSKAYQNAEKSWQGKPPAKNSPWHTNFAEMAVKTVIRHFAKQLPLSIQKAVALDDAFERGEDNAYLDESGSVIEGEFEQTFEEDDSPRPERETEETEPFEYDIYDQFGEMVSVCHSCLEFYESFENIVRPLKDSSQIIQVYENNADAYNALAEIRVDLWNNLQEYKEAALTTRKSEASD